MTTAPRNYVRTLDAINAEPTLYADQTARYTQRDAWNEVQSAHKAPETYRSATISDLPRESKYFEDDTPESPYLNEWNANHDDEQGSVWVGALSERPRGLESALDAYRARKATSPVEEWRRRKIAKSQAEALTWHIENGTLRDEFTTEELEKTREFYAMEAVRYTDADEQALAEYYLS